MIRRPTRRRRLYAGKAESAEIQLVDKGVNNAHRIIFGDIVIERTREQPRLASVFSLDKTGHDTSCEASSF